MELEAAAGDETPEAERVRQFELLICAMHFLGDGMALHAFANDFFALLGGEKTEEGLQELLEEEWRARWATAPEEVGLPLTSLSGRTFAHAQSRIVAAAVTAVRAPVRARR